MADKLQTDTDDDFDAGALLLEDDTPPADGDSTFTGLDDDEAPPPVADDDSAPPKPPDGDDGDGDGPKDDGDNDKDKDKDKDKDADKKKDEEDDEDETPVARPKITLGNVVLFILNIAAGVGVAFLLVTTFEKRQSYSYTVFKFDLALWGLPLDEETQGISASRELAAGQPLEPEWLKRAFDRRKTGGTLKDKFAPTPDLTAPRISADQLGPDTLKEMFASVGGEPVKTLQAEIKRLENKLPGEIDELAASVAKGAEGKGAKARMLDKLLMSLAFTTLQVDVMHVALAKAIAKADEKELDELITEAARRKIIYDVLAAFEEYAPSGGEELEKLRELDNFASLTAVAEINKAYAKAVKDKKALDLDLEKLVPALTVASFDVDSDRVKAMLAERLQWTVSAKEWEQHTRDTIDKRRAVAFMLFTLSQVRKPGEPPPVKEVVKDEKDEKADKEKEKAKDPTPTLYKPERAEVVVGTNEFTQAAETYAQVKPRLEQRRQALAALDLGQGMYSVEHRVHEPEKLVANLRDLFDKLGLIPLEDKAGWKKFEEKAIDHLAKKQGEILNGADLLRELEVVMGQAGVNLVEGPEPVVAEAKRALLKAGLQRLAAVPNEADYAFQLAGLLNTLHYPIADDKKFAEAAQVCFKANLAAVKEPVAVLEEALKQKGLALKDEPEPLDVKKAVFSFRVQRLLDPREAGYLGNQHEAVKRLRDVVKYIDELERRVKELGLQYEELARQYDERDGHEKKLRAQLLDARKESRRMMRGLQELQQQLFNAQLEMADADLNNQAMERRIRQLERFKGGSKTP